MSLLIRNGLILTMNDRFEVVHGDVSDSRRPHRRRRQQPSRHPRHNHRRARRLRLARIHPDAPPSLPDAVPRLRRRLAPDGLAAHAHLADGSRAHAGDAPRRGAPGDDRASLQRHDLGADHGDRARHGRRVRSGRGERHAGHHRQVHDGLRQPGPPPAAGGDAVVDRREPGHPAALGGLGPGPAARGLRAEVRGLLLARASRGRRQSVERARRAGAHARLRVCRTNRRLSGRCRAD